MRRRAFLATFALPLLGSVSGLAQPQPPAPARGPLILVVDSPLVEKWLGQAGVPYLRRSGSDLGAAPISGPRLLVLPMEAVTTPGAVTTVRDFVAQGGKVLAVYWGTLALSGNEAAPAFQLADVLGVRPVSWTGTPPQPMVLTDSSPGVLPSVGVQLSLPSTPAVLVEPLPGTEVLARWGEDDAAPPSRSGAIFLREGVLYCGGDVLRPGNNRGDARECFFWAVQRLAPDFGPGMQARDRIFSAASALSGLQLRLGMMPNPEVQAGAEHSLGLLTEARAHLAEGRAARASQSADRARAVALEALERLRGR